MHELFGSPSMELLPKSPDVDVISCTPAPTMAVESREEPSTTPSACSSSSNSNEKRYFCQRCLNHRLEFPRKGHKPYCRYANCECDDCIMVERRRQLNNQLSKRKLDPNAPRPEPGVKKVRDPKCARCSAHGKDQALRGHKRALCPYSECVCNLCKLVENRRSLMARQIKLRRDQQKARKAQQALDETEDEIRRSIDLDLGSPVKFGEFSAESSQSPASPDQTAPIRPKPMRKRSRPFDLDSLLQMQMNMDTENQKPSVPSAEESVVAPRPTKDAERLEVVEAAFFTTFADTADLPQPSPPASIPSVLQTPPASKASPVQLAPALPMGLAFSLPTPPSASSPVELKAPPKPAVEPNPLRSLINQVGAVPSAAPFDLASHGGLLAAKDALPAGLQTVPALCGVGQALPAHLLPPVGVAAERLGGGLLPVQPQMTPLFNADAWLLFQQQQHKLALAQREKAELERAIMTERARDLPDVVPVSTTLLQHLFTLAARNL